MNILESYHSGSEDEAPDADQITSSQTKQSRSEGIFEIPSIQHYIPSSDSALLSSATSSSSTSTSLILAPISLSASSNTSLIQYNQKELLNNPTIEIVLAPMQGPAHPYRFNEAQSGRQQVGMGQIEEAAMEDWTFDDQYQTYLRHGYAIDPNNNSVLGDVNAFITTQQQSNTVIKERIANTKRKRIDDNYLDLGDSQNGPWATMPEPKYELQVLSPVEDNNEEKVPLESIPVPIPSLPKSKRDKNKLDQPLLQSTDGAIPDNVHIVEPDEEAEMWERVNERKLTFTLPPRPSRGSCIGEAKSTFHGTEERDYQGRSWISPPSGIRPDDGDHDCFIPKKCVKKYTGHTKGVQAIEFFPQTGHLLLSASLDGKCKIWDVYGDRNVKRTYIGHEEAIKSIHMANDGLSFLSSAFDRYMRLWDVETGQAKATFCNRKMGYQVRFHPKDNNVFLMAASDNKIYQWDARAGTVVQEYNYHLQPCSTITFFDEGRRFVSTSDDKKILVWEFDIPVPIKYIQDPSMKSIPSVTLAPDGRAFAGQSMDNTIVCYLCGDKVKKLSKKVFRGHSNVGYACQIGFSPNSHFVMSGDSTGKLHVWDWKTTKPYRKFQAHDGGPCLGALWHPIEPSLVATCGWDGMIKLWD